MTDKLNPCPFCGGKAHLEVTHRFKGSGGFKALVLFVSHDKQCIIADKDAITFGYVTFDHKSEMGKYALDGLKRQAAELWNRRAE